MRWVAAFFSLCRVKFQSQLSKDVFRRFTHLVLLLFFCGVVRSQLDFFVNSGEEDEETTQAPFLTLDVEVQEEVPNGDLHDVPNGDTHEEEQESGSSDSLAESAMSEGGEEGEVDPVEEEGSQNPDEETTTLGYIDPSELMGEQVVYFESRNPKYICTLCHFRIVLSNDWFPHKSQKTAVSLTWFSLETVGAF